MIVDNKLAQEHPTVDQTMPDTAPPPYEPRCAAGPSTIPSSFPWSLARTAPANDISVIRSMSTLKELYLIDPELGTPAGLLPASARRKKNLFLQMTMGSLDATIGIADSAVPGGDRIEMEANCLTAGTVFVKVYASDSITRRRFQLSAYATCGTTTAHIPRSFHGFITITLPFQPPDVSKAIRCSPHFRVISDVGGSWKAFLGGELPSSSEDWRGDEVILGAGVGSVTLKFNDEKWFYNYW